MDDRISADEKFTVTSPSSASGRDATLERVFALSLMTIAGSCDAAGFMLFAQLYVSFMSGDATQLGLKLQGGDWGAVAKFFGCQATFVAGAALGRYFRKHNLRYGRRTVLIANFLLLGATAILAPVLGLTTIVFAALAMGFQNAVITHEAGTLVGTMITGTLARLGFSIADMLSGEHAAFFDNAAQWFFFVFGAVVGGFSSHLFGAASFWIPAVASLFLIPLATRLPRMIDHPKAQVA